MTNQVIWTIVKIIKTKEVNHKNIFVQYCAYLWLKIENTYGQKSPYNKFDMRKLLLYSPATFMAKCVQSPISIIEKTF